MNGLRRALLVVYSLLLAGAAGGFIALVWTSRRKLDIEFDDFNMEAFIDAGDLERGLFTGLMALIALLALGTLVIAVIPGRGGRRGMLQLKQTDGGIVEVAPATLEALVSAALEAHPEIRKATARVRPGGGGIESDLDLAIEPSASIAQVTTLASSTTAQALRDQAGVANVRRPRIRISYEEITARPAGSVPHPAPPPPPPPAEHTEDHHPDA